MWVSGLGLSPPTPCNADFCTIQSHVIRLLHHTVQLFFLGWLGGADYVQGRAHSVLSTFQFISASCGGGGLSTFQLISESWERGVGFLTVEHSARRADTFPVVGCAAAEKKYTVDT